MGTVASAVGARSGAAVDDSQCDTCRGDSGVPIRATEDSIDGLVLFAPCDQGLRVCPTAVDSVISGGQNGTGPGVPWLGVCEVGGSSGI